MDAVNQVRMRRRTKNPFRIRMMLQVELQQVLIARKGLDTYLYCTFLTMIILFWSQFLITFKPLAFPRDSSMLPTSWLGRPFPYISIIYCYVSLSSDTLVITVGTKTKW